MTSPSFRTSEQHGQVVPVMGAVIVLVALITLGVAHVGRQAVDRARAQNAADAAALAAAVQLDPADAAQIARRLADRNGAELVEVHRIGPVVTVRVRLSGHDAVAAARPVAGQSVPDP